MKKIESMLPGVRTGVSLQLTQFLTHLNTVHFTVTVVTKEEKIFVKKMVEKQNGGEICEDLNLPCLGIYLV